VSSLISLTNPPASASPCALPLAVHGNWATLTFQPFWSASSRALRLGVAEAGHLRLNKKVARGIIT